MTGALTRLRPEMRSETDRNYKPGFNDLQGGHDDAPLLIAYGGPNHERSPLPLLTVLPLLSAREREDKTSEVWAPQRSFFARSVGDKWENPRNDRGVTYPLQVPYTKRRKNSPR